MEFHTVRFTAYAIGVFIAALPGVTYGPLFYRSMETDKNQALHRGKGDYNSTMSFSAAALTEVQWWHDNISRVHHFIHAPVDGVPPMVSTQWEVHGIPHMSYLT